MPSNIRNFCIIAHIDHGKSTLSDRILEITGTVDPRKMGEQMLDSLAIEKERGITIKSAAVTISYKAPDGEEYILNLIDTPGHVDFTYEVSRSLAACEGALLVIDASQGVEAQTLANYFLAIDANLTILPVINKIDLPSADVEGVKVQIENELSIPAEEAVAVSAKTGININGLLEKLIHVIPPPATDREGRLQCLIFDSFFDTYRGAVVCIRVRRGEIKVGDKVKMFHADFEYQVEELGLLGITRKKLLTLSAGEVGYAILGIKSVSDVRIGDTLISVTNPSPDYLPGYKEVKPMVFAGLFPIDTDDYHELKDSLEKLKLNDSALSYEVDSSTALGFGFRCGFLGLLHMEVVAERLEREFGIQAILTAPSVRYQVKLGIKGRTDGESIIVDNPAKMPDLSAVQQVLEPWVRASIISPAEFLGNIMSLIQDKRGIQLDIKYLDTKRIEGHFELPLAEIIFDFFDRLKSVTRGYASMDYEISDWREAEIVKVDILVNKEPVDALSFLVHTVKSRERGKQIIEKLKDEIPRHQFHIPIQAAIGSDVIAREDISAMRKDVTAKCYGGDISRKRKLLEKQKEGKKKMKSIGSVDIPQKAFINILKS